MDKTRLAEKRYREKKNTRTITVLTTNYKNQKRQQKNYKRKSNMN